MKFPNWGVTRPAEDYSGLPTYDRPLIEFYDGAARKNTFFHHLVSWMVLVSGASIAGVGPIINFIDSPKVSGAAAIAFITTVIGLVVVISEGSNKLFRFQERMVLYRGTREAIRTEVLLFRGGVDGYKDLNEEDAERFFVKRIAELQRTESSEWLSIAASDPGRDAKPADPEPKGDAPKN